MREAVVFIHGLWLTGLELSLLRRRVRQCGFACFQFHYRSLLATPTQNAARLNAFLLNLDAEVIHLVAHSLGGVVVMHLFAAFPQQKPGRIVLLGSPVNGSSVALAMNRNLLTRAVLGRSTRQGLLGNVPRWKGARELGMIAGTRGPGLGTLLTLGKLTTPNDGTVAVQETKTSAISCHLQVPYSHFTMLFAKPVARTVCAFLHSGNFAD